MIELLLQAERALSAGLVDQAERMYAQAAAADPRSSIAVVGLARVALEREDDATAYRLAKQALGIDPENVAAARLADRLEELYAHRGLPVPGQGARDEESVTGSPGEAAVATAPSEQASESPVAEDVPEPPVTEDVPESAAATVQVVELGMSTGSERADDDAVAPPVRQAPVQAPAPGPPPSPRNEPVAPPVRRTLIDRLLGRNQR